MMPGQRLLCSALSVSRRAAQGSLGAIARQGKGVCLIPKFAAAGVEMRTGGTGRGEQRRVRVEVNERIPVLRARQEMWRHVHLAVTRVGGTGVLRLAEDRRGGKGVEGVRLMSGAAGNNDEVLVFTSASEAAMKSLALAAVGQVAVCTIMGGLLIFHPQAATSSLLPGFTFQGRAGLAAGIVGFGAIFAQGTRSFLSKQIMRVATLPSDPEMLHVYTLDFPFSLKCNKVPRSQFYAISAAYQHIDLEKERKEAYILPMYVGGDVRQTLIIDLRGELIDLEVMHELLTKAAKEEAAKADWSDDDKEPKKTFVPNRHRKSL